VSGKKVQTTQVQPNLEAEQGVLAILLDDSSTLPQVADNLRAEHFAEPFHRVIYTAIVETVRENLIASPVTVRSRVETHPSYAEVGGQAYLDRLAKLSLRPSLIASYAAAMIENHARRTLVAEAEAVLSEATTGSAPLGSIADRIAKAAGSVRETLSGTGGRKTRFTFEEAVTAAVERAATAYQFEGQHPDAVMTGLGALDRHMGGFVKGDLVIVAGRPGMGKTALAVKMAYNIAAAHRPAIVLSLEMHASQVAIREISAAMTIPKTPYTRILKGRFTEEEYGRIVEAARRISPLPLPIVSPGRMTLAAIEATVAREKAENPELAMVVLDYLQLVQTDESSGQNKADRVGDVTAALKGLAGRQQVVMVVLSQLSRGVESRDDKRPMISDLRDSGAIEQDADIILFPFREEYYLSRSEPAPGSSQHIDWTEKLEKVRGTMEIIIGKFRMGETATVRLRAEMATNTIEDLPREQVEMF
jgi:replicative DNA helicase